MTLLLQPGQTLDDRYRIDRSYASGGMAVVYLSTDLKLGRTVAVKVMSTSSSTSDASRRRFIREIQTLAHLDHPHIVRIYDFGETPSLQPFIVMPFVKGPSLHLLLQQRGPLDVESTSRILEGISQALDYVNSQDVIHRDVKPLNVLMEPEPGLFAYLADFGIASIADGSALTGRFQPRTDEYASPEQARDEPNLTAQSDQFSLACVAYEMLTGRSPFGADPAGSMLARFSGLVPDPRTIHPGLSERVTDVFRVAFSPQPHQRYASSTDFVSHLILALNKAPQSQGPSPASPTRVVPDRATTEPHISVPDAQVAQLSPDGLDILVHERTPRALTHLIEKPRADNVIALIGEDIAPGQYFSVAGDGAARSPEGQELGRIQARDFWWGVIDPNDPSAQDIENAPEPLPALHAPDGVLRSLDELANKFWGLDTAGPRPKYSRFFEGGWRFSGYRQVRCPRCQRALAEFDKARGQDRYRRSTRWRAYFCPSCIETYGISELGEGSIYPHDYKILFD